MVKVVAVIVCCSKLCESSVVSVMVVMFFLQLTV